MFPGDGAEREALAAAREVEGRGRARTPASMYHLHLLRLLPTACGWRVPYVCGWHGDFGASWARPQLALAVAGVHAQVRSRDQGPTRSWAGCFPGRVTCGVSSGARRGAQERGMSSV